MRTNVPTIKINGDCARTARWQVAGVEADRGFASRLPDPQQSLAARKVERAVNHMLQNVNQPLRISTLSAMSGVSVSLFFSLFKSATGSSPMVFFIRLRMQRARDLLRNRELSVKETAFLLGYNDPCYFSRLFKRVNGIAPRDYRNSAADLAKEKQNRPTCFEDRLNPEALV